MIRYFILFYTNVKLKPKKQRIGIGGIRATPSKLELPGLSSKGVVGVVEHDMCKFYILFFLLYFYSMELMVFFLFLFDDEIDGGVPTRIYMDVCMYVCFFFVNILLLQIQR